MDQHQIGMTTLSSHPYGISRKVGFIAGTPPASSRSNTRLSAIKWRFPSDPTITTTAIRASTAPTKLSKDFMFFAVSYFFDYSKELDRAFTPSSFFSNHPGDFYTLGQDSIFCPLTCQITNLNFRSQNPDFDFKIAQIEKKTIIFHFIWCTVFEIHRKSLIQHCERSELRLHFVWTKVN